MTGPVRFYDKPEANNTDMNADKIEIRLIRQLTARRIAGPLTVGSARGPTKKRQLLTLLALAYPNGLSATYIQDHLCWAEDAQQRMHECIYHLKQDLRRLLELDQDVDPVVCRGSQFFVDFGEDLFVDHRAFLDLLKERDKLGGFSRSREDLERAWMLLDQAVGLVPESEGNLLPGLDGLTCQYGMETDLARQVRRATIQRTEVGLELGHYQLVGDDARRLFLDDPCDDRLAQLFTKLECALSGPAAGMDVVRAHRDALAERGLVPTRGMAGLENCLLRDDLSFLSSGIETSRESGSAPATPDDQWLPLRFRIDLEAPPSVVEQSKHRTVRGHSQSLEGNWLQVTYADTDRCMRHAPWSIEWVKCESTSVGEYRARWWRTWPDRLENSWSCLMSDGGGLPVAIYGATGPTGGYGTIHLSNVDTDWYTGFYLEEKLFVRGQSIAFELMVGPLIWVRAESEYAHQYLEVMQQIPTAQLRTHLPSDVFGLLEGLLRAHQ